MERDDGEMPRERNVDEEKQDLTRWLVVDTRSGRYLGKVVSQEQFRTRQVPEGTDALLDPSINLTHSDELILESIVSIQMINVPTREGIIVQGVPSSPVPWHPPFARELHVRIPINQIVWYDDVDPDIVAKIRAALMAQGGPRPLGMS